MTPPSVSGDGKARPQILAGGPARETSSLTYQLHRESLERQAGDGFAIDVRHEVVKDTGGARWQHGKIERVAVSREIFMDIGASCPCGSSKWYADSQRLQQWKPGAVCRVCESPRRHDALFMVDSDVILGPGVLKRMWEVDADVVYGVYLTYSDWGGSMHHWPQVWNVNPYGWTQECADALNAEGVNEVDVLGGGACTLIRGRGFESHYWPLLQSLVRLPGMWGGEDRSYCIGLEARGIKQVAVTGLPIHHCYNLADQTAPALKRIKEKVGL
jgi:hypothetical protein